jgi:hypothetical protein
MKRHWNVDRQAYVPRKWPQVLTSAALAWAAVYFGLPRFGPWILAVPVVLAYVIPAVRLKIWKRRHPRVTDYVSEQRRVARWQ